MKKFFNRVFGKVWKGIKNFFALLWEVVSEGWKPLLILNVIFWSAILGVAALIYFADMQPYEFQSNLVQEQHRKRITLHDYASNLALTVPAGVSVRIEKCGALKYFDVEFDEYPEITEKDKKRTSCGNDNLEIGLIYAKETEYKIRNVEGDHYYTFYGSEPFTISLNM